jgi:hypothetical protein
MQFDIGWVHQFFKIGLFDTLHDIEFFFKDFTRLHLKIINV